VLTSSIPHTRFAAGAMQKIAVLTLHSAEHGAADHVAVQLATDLST